MRLIQITDLHLSDRTDTPAADALRWAIDTCNTLAPDLVAFTGDMTTYGTAASASQFLEQANRLSSPWVFTPGNAERRSPGGMEILGDIAASQSLSIQGIRYCLPDTSTGSITSEARERLQDQDADGPHVVLTHYPIDTLDDDSRQWIKGWLSSHRVELYLAGHRHFTRSRNVGGCLEVITRGLDPDKAFGGPPGISLFKRDAQGRWSEQVIAWPRGQDLLPAETDHNPVGWSIHGDPVLAAQETQEAGLNVLELRPKEPTYDITATREIVNRIRDERSLYLSWHLPSLSWDEDKQTVVGQEEILRQTEDARSCGLDALTIHVPQVGAHRMTSGNDPWLAFLSAFETCFKSAAESGVRISIENVHNNPGTPVQREHRKYATLIDEYLEWIDAIRGAFGTAGSSVGAHFDVGHARNNGELGNIQPLGDWYARIGDRITGYHIHQVRPHEETRKLTNHRDIRSLHDRTVSYAGFLHAWSARMINRAPLFVEVRIAGERRRTTRMLRDVFLSTDH